MTQNFLSWNKWEVEIYRHSTINSSSNIEISRVRLAESYTRVFSVALKCTFVFISGVSLGVNSKDMEKFSEKKIFKNQYSLIMKNTLIRFKYTIQSKLNGYC